MPLARLATPITIKKTHPSRVGTEGYGWVDGGAAGYPQLNLSQEAGTAAFALCEGKPSLGGEMRVLFFLLKNGAFFFGVVS